MSSSNWHCRTIDVSGEDYLYLREEIRDSDGDILFTVIIDQTDGEVRVYHGSAEDWPPIGIKLEGEVVHYK